MPENRELVQRHEREVRSETRLRYVRDSIVAGVVLAVLTSLALVFWDKQNDQNDFLAVSRANARQSEENARAIGVLSRQVTDLEAALSAARAQIEAGATTQEAANRCVNVANASLSFAVADLVVTIASTTPGSPERADLIASAVDAIVTAKDYLYVVLRDRPVDCPPPANPGETPP